MNKNILIIPKEEAKEYMVKNHYTHTLPAACVCLGAYDDNRLIGVAVFGKTARPAMAQTLIPYLREADYYELQRFHTLDDTEKNFESWFLTNCMEWVKKNPSEYKDDNYLC